MMGSGSFGSHGVPPLFGAYVTKGALARTLVMCRSSSKRLTNSTVTLWPPVPVAHVARTIGITSRRPNSLRSTHTQRLPKATSAPTTVLITAGSDKSIRSSITEKASPNQPDILRAVSACTDAAALGPLRMADGEA